MHRIALNSLGKAVKKAPGLQNIHSEFQYQHNFPSISSYANLRSYETIQRDFLLPTTKSHNLVTKAYYSQNAPDKRPSFFGNIISNLKQEFEKNKDMQDSLKKFRDEAKQLEDSEALKEARKKFESIEGEATKGSSAFKEQLGGIKDKMKDTIDEASKSEAAKKAGEFSKTIGKQAESFTKVAENIGQSQYVKSASHAAASLREELEGQSFGKVYRPPVQLRKRKEVLDFEGGSEKPIEANTEATGVELHKDSKFYAGWQNFKENNPVYTKFVDYRMKYEESDNPMVRGARMLTDKVQDVFGGMFAQTDMSQVSYEFRQRMFPKLIYSIFVQVLTEIIKMDPNFCKEQFLKDCEKDIIPNILEAQIRGDLDILQDWCFEAMFNVLATPIRQAQQLGYMFDSQILDIDDVDIAMGKMMDQGPVLAITFTAQQILCLRDSKGTVIEGDPDKVMRITYIWVLCRDQSELDPRAAWRLLELAATNQAEQFL